jgi:oligopeptide transport system substrate-binding protein
LLVLQRKDYFYGDKALLNQINFILYSGNPLNLYQEGQIDVSPVYSSYIGWATDPSNSVSKELHVYDSLSFSYVGFNTTQSPFDDPKVRQAFTYAVDKTKIIALTANNLVIPAYGILPPDMPGYNPDLQGLKYDPQKAKQLISESKYGSVFNLPPIVFTTSGWGNGISSIIGGLIEQWRENLGVEVTVRQIEPDYYSYTIYQEKNNLFDLGWSADYPDPQDFLDILFRTGSQSNNGGYSNPQLDALLGQAAADQDTAKRISEYRQAEQIIVDDAAVLPLYFGREYFLVKPYVQNYVVSPLGFPVFSKVGVTR